MTMAWTNTQKALKEFADTLKCMGCDSEPILPTRSIHCGHVFCLDCGGTESYCSKCNKPVRPNERIQDNIIASLVNGCNTISKIVNQRSLWNTRIHKPDHQARTVPLNSPSQIQPTDPNKSNVSLRRAPKNINKGNPQGETKLHVACLKPNVERVKSLLMDGANPNTKDFAGWTPLQEVVSYGLTNMCRLLLENGALPNTTGIESKTALHEAAIKNRLEEAKLLLQYNASLNVYDQYGKTPKDYASGKILELFEEQEKLNETLDKSSESHNATVSSMIATNCDIVVYAPKLNKQNEELLSKIVAKHHIRVASTFVPSVTHLVLETNGLFSTNSDYDVMLALIRGCCLVDSAWLSCCLETDDIATMASDGLELDAAPIPNVPKKARENAEQKNPGLFNNCKFYFALQANEVYTVGDVKFTKASLVKLVTEGGGTELKREPDLSSINKDRTVPFHIANNPKHPLYNCTHYIIYVPEKNQPRRLYNMSHIKSLPLLWLIESIEKFTLMDPTHLGIL